MINSSNSPRKFLPSKDSLSTIDLTADEPRKNSEEQNTIKQLSLAMLAARDKGIHYQFFSWQAKKKLLIKSHYDFLENPSIDSLIKFILTAKKQRAPKFNRENCTKSIKNLIDFFKEIPDLAHFIQELPDEMGEEDILILKKELYSYFPELNNNIFNSRNI